MTSKTPLPPWNPTRTEPGPGTGSLSPAGGGVGRLILAGLLLVPLVGCATKADVRDLQNEIRELNARQEALLREVQSEQRVQRDSIRGLSVQFGEHRAQQAMTLRALEDHVIRVQELTGLSQQEISALRDQWERRSLPGPTSPQQGAGTGGGEAQEVFDAAMVQYNRGQLTAAQWGFEDLVARYGSHELAPSARYYLADILVQREELEAAIEAFLRIGEFHPDSDRVPESLYRIGMIYKDQGDIAEARRYFERVVNTWPDSGAAQLAERELQDL